MTARNNQERFGARPQSDSPAAEATQAPAPSLSFAVPTEFVELPSKGRFYPQGHPLHNQETIEIKYMTAKEEDILTSQTLLRKGIALDRLLQSVILNKQINADDLIVGDKNAVLVAARITGYGEEYTVSITCPQCTTVQDFNFDLANPTLNYGDESCLTDAGTFMVELPRTKAKVELRLTTGKDESRLIAMAEKKKKHKLPESALTDQLQLIIQAVNGVTDARQLKGFVENLPAFDARFLRKEYARIMPNIDLTQEFSCAACMHEEEMEVPFTTAFFWPE